MNAPRILVADDESDLLKVMLLRLIHTGYEAWGATDGQEALGEARQKVPDLIILDVMMPDKDGIRVLEELHGDPVTASIPVIMASAVVKPEIWKQAITLGAREFLEKPFNMAKMRETIRKYIAPGNGN